MKMTAIAIAVALAATAYPWSQDAPCHEYSVGTSSCRGNAQVENGAVSIKLSDAFCESIQFDRTFQVLVTPQDAVAVGAWVDSANRTLEIRSSDKTKTVAVSWLLFGTPKAK